MRKDRAGQGARPRATGKRNLAYYSNFPTGKFVRSNIKQLLSAVKRPKGSPLYLDTCTCKNSLVVGQSKAVPVGGSDKEVYNQSTFPAGIGGQISI